jgi:hypothetical protein
MVRRGKVPGRWGRRRRRGGGGYGAAAPRRPSAAARRGWSPSRSTPAGTPERKLVEAGTEGAGEAAVGKRWRYLAVAGGRDRHRRRRGGRLLLRPWAVAREPRDGQTQTDGRVHGWVVVIVTRPDCVQRLFCFVFQFTVRFREEKLGRCRKVTRSEIEKITMFFLRHTVQTMTLMYIRIHLPLWTHTQAHHTLWVQNKTFRGKFFGLNRAFYSCYYSRVERGGRLIPLCSRAKSTLVPTFAHLHYSLASVTSHSPIAL